LATSSATPSACPSRQRRHLLRPAHQLHGTEPPIERVRQGSQPFSGLPSRISFRLLDDGYDAATGLSTATTDAVGGEPGHWSFGLWRLHGLCFSGILATTADIIAPTYLDAGTLSLVGPAGGSRSRSRRLIRAYTTSYSAAAMVPGPALSVSGQLHPDRHGRRRCGPVHVHPEPSSDLSPGQHGRHRFGDPFQTA